MAEEDSQLCLQSAQFMTHNMLATSLPRSNIFSWTSKTSQRESLKAFWIIHGSVVKLPMKQQAGFEGQGDLRIGQLSFSFCFYSQQFTSPQQRGWGIPFFISWLKGRAGNEIGLLAFEQFLSFQFPTGTFCCPADVKEWKKSIWKSCLYLYTKPYISELTFCIWVLLVLTWLTGKLDDSSHQVTTLQGPSKPHVQLDWFRLSFTEYYFFK